MSKGTIRLNGNDLQRMISESVNEAMKEWRFTRNEKNPVDDDGKYRYMGTGSEESKERLKRLKDKRFLSGNGIEGNDYHGHPGLDNQMKNGSSGDFNPSRSDMAKKEYGKFEGDVDFDDYSNPAPIFLRSLREFAVGKMDSDDLVNTIKLHVKTKEDAQKFLKYLYQNGFKSK